MNLLVCGDSFSYDHKIQHSWPTRLGQQHFVDNISQCGCGEYKIKLQLESKNLNDYDAILIFHTSPYRLHYKYPNRMHADNFHNWSDLIFSDVEHHRHDDPVAKVAHDYFVHIFDEDYYLYLHNLICRDIYQNTQAHRTFHFTAFDYSDLYRFDNQLNDLYSVWKHNPGSVNHLNENGHKEFFNHINRAISL